MRDGLTEEGTTEEERGRGRGVSCCLLEQSRVERSHVELSHVEPTREKSRSLRGADS